MQVPVYSAEGALLAPTSNSKARRLLRQKRARVKSYKPFSIQLITQNKQEEEVKMDLKYTTTRERGIKNLERFKPVLEVMATQRQKGYTTTLIGMALLNKNIHIVVVNCLAQSDLVHQYPMLKGRIHTLDGVADFMRGRDDDIILMWDNHLFNVLSCVVSSIVNSQEIVGYMPASEESEIETMKAVSSDVDAETEFLKSMVSVLTPENFIHWIIIKQYSVLEKMVTWFPEEIEKIFDSEVMDAIERTNDMRIYKIFLGIISAKKDSSK